MSGTSVRYTGHARRSVEILRDGRVISEMDVAKFCELDSDLAECATRAMECVGQSIAVSRVARVQRPRHSVMYGISQ